MSVCTSGRYTRRGQHTMVINILAVTTNADVVYIPTYSISFIGIGPVSTKSRGHKVYIGIPMVGRKGTGVSQHAVSYI